jgi:hypothetical protein
LLPESFPVLRVDNYRDRAKFVLERVIGSDHHLRRGSSLGCAGELDFRLIIR